MPNNPAKVEQRRLRSSYFTSTISISLLLLLLGLVGLLLLKTKQLSNHVKENIHFKVILFDNVPEVEILRIQKSLDARKYVKETIYITKDDAAAILQESLGEDFIATLGYNPLLPTIEVKFLASYANNDSIPIIESDLKEFDGIKEVYYQKNLIQAVNDNIQRISLYILLFSGLFFLIALSLINNTIRLSIYAKRFIIRTMQLVGATSNYIRKPFLYKAIFQGVIAGLFGNLILTVIIYLLQKQMGDQIFLNDIKILAILYGIVVCLGITLNYFSTYLAVTKFLHIKTDKLYT